MRIAVDWVMGISKGLERKDNLIKFVISDIHSPSTPRLLVGTVFETLTSNTMS